MRSSSLLLEQLAEDKPTAAKTGSIKAPRMRDRGVVRAMVYLSSERGWQKCRRNREQEPRQGLFQWFFACFCRQMG